ncbi:MAG: zinc-ribbon domain-containing protein, partial [Chloroflexi bacterium]|nr:zinc-ribbon domain-containing protein [Chloroflexota bacterium]
MAYCPNCGTEAEPSFNYCSVCGRDLTGRSSTATVQQVPQELPSTLDYHISVRRILIMSVLSHGLYLFYWFFLTWKQYRDHTGNPVFPVWHA